MLLMLLMGVPGPMLWMPMLSMLPTAGAPEPGIKSIKGIKSIEASALDQKTGQKGRFNTFDAFDGVPRPMLWMPMLSMLPTAGAPEPGIKSIKGIKRIEASPLDQQTGQKRTLQYV